MTENVLRELLQLERDLEIRVSLLRPDQVPFFRKDQERLRRLIESLSQSDANAQSSAP